MTRKFVREAALQLCVRMEQKWLEDSFQSPIHFQQVHHRPEQEVCGIPEVRSIPVVKYWVDSTNIVNTGLQHTITPADAINSILRVLPTHVLLLHANETSGLRKDCH